MTRYRAPEIRCDYGEGECDETTPDYYEGTADSVDGVKITISKRAPGWFSTLDADYCPEHLPWLAGKESDR